MVGSYTLGEFEGFNFSSEYSQKIMDRNDYKMVPAEVIRESDISRMNAGPTPPFMGGQIFVEQGFEKEIWSKITYVPKNAYRRFEGSTRQFFNWSFSPGGSRLHQKHVDRYSCDSENSLKGWFQGIINPKFLETIYATYDGQIQDPSGVQKYVIKP